MVTPSAAYAGTVASVGTLPSAFTNLAEPALSATVFSVPEIVAFPGANATTPDCSSPWMFVDSAGVAVGTTPTIVGV